MENIHLLPTDKPSRLIRHTNSCQINLKDIDKQKRKYYKYNIYITSSEEIKEGDWYFITESISKCESKYEANDLTDICKKIILTTDQDLIAHGVQVIDDEFLEWFVKNPTCEFVEVTYQLHKDEPLYKIIIPQEEPKQERMYSEEDVIAFMQFIISNPDLSNTSSVSETTARYYLEQFKKK